MGIQILILEFKGLLYWKWKEDLAKYKDVETYLDISKLLAP